MSETVKKIVYVRKRALSNADSDTENEKNNRATSENKEPVKDEPKPKIQPVVEKKVNMISTYFEAKKKEKNEFLMSGIMESLEENEDIIQTNTINMVATQVEKKW